MNLTINLKQKTIDKIAEEGNPKHIIERIIKEQYGEKEEQE